MNLAVWDMTSTIICGHLAIVTYMWVCTGTSVGLYLLVHMSACPVIIEFFVLYCSTLRGRAHTCFLHALGMDASIHHL